LYAFIVKPDQTAAMQPIKVALQQDGKAVVSSGIAPGTRVVVDGQFRLRPGVKVVETQARANAGGDGDATPGSANPAEVKSDTPVDASVAGSGSSDGKRK